MRRRNIKSVAHWVVMCFILLFPIVMVGVSSFAQPQQEINVTETYEYETNEVNSADDLIVGHIYQFTINSKITDADYNIVYSNFFRFADLDFYLATRNDEDFYTLRNNRGDGSPLRLVNTSTWFTYYQLPPTFNDWPLTINFIYQGPNTISYITWQDIHASDYLGEHTIDYTITDETMREDVNQWCASFRNLPVNVWYGNLLTAVGLGITTSMMMNVIYTYPLYVLWVYILDLVVDIFLVIINFGHNALKRLGGDNE